jgi:hypothetical protein
MCDVGPKMPNVQSAHVQSTWRHLAVQRQGIFRVSSGYPPGIRVDMWSSLGIDWDVLVVARQLWRIRCSLISRHRHEQMRAPWTHPHSSFVSGKSAFIHFSIRRGILFLGRTKNAMQVGGSLFLALAQGSLCMASSQFRILTLKFLEIVCFVAFRSPIQMVFISECGYWDAQLESGVSVTWIGITIWTFEK